VHRKVHAGFGKRSGETDPPHGGHRAPGRLSPTGHSGNRGVYHRARRPAHGGWVALGGRANLPRADRAPGSDRPQHLLRRDQTPAAVAGQCGRTAGGEAAAGHCPGASPELQRLWRPQGVVDVEPGRHRGGSLHGGAVDEAARPAWGAPGPDGANHLLDPAAACPADLVQREFNPSRPDALWVADFSYVPTWAGLVYAAFAIDAFSRRILGWQVATSMRTELVLDALEMAIWTRQRAGVDELSGLVHHSDAGSQYTSIRFTQRLAEAGAAPSVRIGRRRL
jgi:Integrase core domain